MKKSYHIVLLFYTLLGISLGSNNQVYAQDNIIFDGIKHEFLGGLSYDIVENEKMKSIVLNPDRTGNQGLSIDLGEVIGNQLLLELPNPSNQETGDFLEMKFYGDWNEKSDVMIYAIRHEVVDRDGELRMKISIEGGEDDIMKGTWTVYDDENNNWTGSSHTESFGKIDVAEYTIANEVIDLDLMTMTSMHIIKKLLGHKVYNPEGEFFPGVNEIQIKPDYNIKPVDFFTKLDLSFSGLSGSKISQEKVLLFGQEIPFYNLGNSTLETSKEGKQIIVSEIGQSGEDGVAIGLRKNLASANLTDYAEIILAKQVIGANSDLRFSIGATGKLGATTATSQVLAATGKSRVATNEYEFTPDFSPIGTTTANIAIYNGAEMTFTQAVSLGESLRLSIPSDAIIASLAYEPGNELAFGYAYEGVQDFVINNSTYLGDKLRISGVSNNPLWLESFTIKGSGFDELIIDDGTVTPLPRSIVDSTFFKLPDVEIGCEEQFCMDITVEDFLNIETFSFTVEFDPSVLNYNSSFFNSNLPPSSSINDNGANNGIVGFFFNRMSILPVSLSDGRTIATICFDVLQKNTSTPIVFSDAVGNRFSSPGPFIGMNGNVIIECDSMSEPPIDILSCCPDLENRITNGDFEEGNAAFESEYTYQAEVAQDAILPGNYGVINSADASTICEQWSIDDHTTDCDGEGNFLVVNGQTGQTGSSIFWSQTIIGLNPEKEYELCAYFKNLQQCCFDVTPTIYVSVDDIRVDTIELDSLGADPCAWQNVNIPIEVTGTSVTINLELDETFIGDGNDFAMDDIALYELAEQELYISTQDQRPDGTPEIMASVNLIDAVDDTLASPECNYRWTIGKVTDLDIAGQTYTPDLTTVAIGDAASTPSWSMTTDFPGYIGTSTLSGSLPGDFDAGMYFIELEVYDCDCFEDTKETKFVGWYPGWGLKTSIPNLDHFKMNAETREQVELLKVSKF